MQISKCKNQNENAKFKNIFLFLFFVFILGGARPALATEYKVYSSEAIGAGDKVYHIESCRKTLSYGPLYCSEHTKHIAPGQCEPRGKLQKVPIKGCYNDPETFIPPANIYPKVDISKYTQNAPNGCADKPEKQGFFYAPEWAVVKGTTTDEIVGTVIFADNNNQDGAGPQPGKQVWEKEYPEGTTTKPLYRPTLCTTWDVPAEGSNAGQPEQPGELEGKVLEFYTNAKGGGTNLINAGCNNDNTTQEIPGLVKSTPFDENNTYTCTIYERITGKSGSDLLGKYISALYRWAAGIVGIVAVLTMVYSGIQISMAGGDTAKLDSAKNRIMQSIIGLAILFLSGLILYTINPGFFTG